MAKSKPKKKAPTKKTAKQAKKNTPMKAKASKVTKTAKPAKKSAVKAKAAAKAVKKSASKPTKPAAPQKTKVATKPATSKSTLNFKNFLSPLENRLFVRVSEGEKRTASGLFIPDSVEVNEGYVRGEVMAVGPGRKDRFGKLHRVGVEVGETVMLAQHAGTPVVMEGFSFIFVRETDIIGVVE